MMLQITFVSLCFSLFQNLRMLQNASKCFNIFQILKNALELLRNYFKIALKCFIMLQITSVSLCFSLFLSVSLFQNLKMLQNASKCFKFSKICFRIASKLLQNCFKMLHNASNYLCFSLFLYVSLCFKISKCFKMLQNASNSQNMFKNCSEITSKLLKHASFFQIASKYFKLLQNVAKYLKTLQNSLKVLKHCFKILQNLLQKCFK